MIQVIDGAAVARQQADFLDTEVGPSVFLRRLRRLLLLRFRAAQFLDAQDIRLVDSCIFATYCDCRYLGAADEARRLLAEARVGGELQLQR